MKAAGGQAKSTMILSNTRRHITLGFGHRSIGSPPPHGEAQNIDRRHAHSFKFPSRYGAGIIRTWPICIRRESTLGLAAISASTLTP